jgi:hypothetical protein
MVKFGWAECGCCSPRGPAQCIAERFQFAYSVSWLNCLAGADEYGAAPGQRGWHLRFDRNITGTANDILDVSNVEALEQNHA